LLLSGLLSPLTEKMPAVEPALTFLLSAQNPDGGWGYTPAQSSTTEPTAAVLLAIGNEPAATDARQQAVDWLRQGQHQDGGWGLSYADKESTWQTAWAVLALARMGTAGDAFDHGVEWLLNVEVLHFADD
jgi:squalene cyclase